MPRKSSGEGLIMVICPWCGRIISLYDLGSKYNKEKYSGSPYPRKSLGQYDVRIEEDGTFNCPFCGAKLRIKPKTIVTLPLRVFRKVTILDREERRLFVTSSKLRDTLGMPETEVGIPGVEGPLEAGVEDFESLQ
jgi:DNA-directed RNA polymerase subunit RPC12/RpoP